MSRQLPLTCAGCSINCTQSLITTYWQHTVCVVLVHNSGTNVTDSRTDASLAHSVSELVLQGDKSSELDQLEADDELDACDDVGESPEILSYIEMSDAFRSTIMLQGCPQLYHNPAALNNSNPCGWRRFQGNTPPGAGGTLLMRPGSKEPVSKASLCNWLRGVYRGLAATHEAGYFHCDIRKENVMGIST